MTFEDEFQRRLLLLMRKRFPAADLFDGTHVDVETSITGYETSGYYSVIDLDVRDVHGTPHCETYTDLGALIRDLSAIVEPLTEQAKLAYLLGTASVHGAVPSPYGAPPNVDEIVGKHIIDTAMGDG